MGLWPLGVIQTSDHMIQKCKNDEFLNDEFMMNYKLHEVLIELNKRVIHVEQVRNTLNLSNSITVKSTLN